MPVEKSYLKKGEDPRPKLRSCWRGTKPIQIASPKASTKRDRGPRASPVGIYLAKILRGLSDELFVFWTTLSFYFLLFLNINNKTLVIAFLILPFIYYLKLRDIRFSLLLAFVASLIFQVGKTYIFELIPAAELNSPLYPAGFNAKLAIRPADILLILMAVVFLRDYFLKKIRFSPDNRLLIVFFVYILWILVNSLVFSQDSGLSLLLSLHLIGSLILFLYALIYLKKRRIAIGVLVAIFSAMVLFQGVLVSLQKLKGFQIGISIETTQEIEVFGEGADEDVFFYRPIGTFQHTNELAAFLLPLVFVILGSTFSTERERNFLSIVFIVGFGTLLLTLGRSAWLSFGAGFLIFLYFIEKRWKLFRFRLTKRTKNYILPALILFSLFVFTVFPRALRTFYSFEETGGAYTRFYLVRESIDAISRNPVAGVGLGNGPRALWEYYIFQEVPHFFSGVHNALLGIALEIGLVGLFLFLLFLYFSFRKLIETVLIQRKKVKPLYLGAILAIFALLLNSMLQPYLHLELILVILAFSVSGSWRLYDTSKFK